MFKKTMAACVFVLCLAAMHAQRPQVALVLAGGSAWGLAHIGVIRVLEEAGIPVDIVVGTSMGSIIGGLYSVGYDSAELTEIATKTDWYYFFKEGSPSGQESLSSIKERSFYALSADFNARGFSMSGGLIRGDRIMRFLDALTLHVPDPVDFDELGRRFRAIATDVATGDAVVISEGSVTDALRASMSIPAIFTPFEIDGRTLVDGGVVDNLPIACAKKLGADIIIAVDLYNGAPFDPVEINRTPISPLARSLEILMRASTRQQLPLADIVIPVDVQGFLPTGFERGPELSEKGEKAARLEMDKLVSLSAYLATFEGGDRAVIAKDFKPIDRIEFTGGTEKDRQAVRSFLAPLEGKTPAAADWAWLFTTIDHYGKIDRLRLHLKQDERGLYHEISLSRPERESNKVRLGLAYESTISSAITGNLDIVPAAIIRGLTTDDSRLLADVEMLDAPGIALRFEQPFANIFCVTPYYEYSRDFTTRLTSSSVAWQYQTIVNSGGVILSITPLPGLSWHTSLSLYSVEGDRIPEIPAPEEGSFYSIVSMGFEFNRLDSPIFPMQGIETRTEVKAARRELGSSGNFTVLTSRGNTFLSLGTPFSVAFLWQAGTDFSVEGDESIGAPLHFKPTLSNRRLFPGPLQTREKTGSHVIGAGLEIKHNLNWNSRGISFPAFLVIHGGVGAVIHNAGDIDWKQSVFHGTVSAGAGIRISDAFGFSLRGGVHRTMENEYLPYLAIDLGAMGR